MSGYQIFFVLSIIILVVLSGACLIRAIKGPKIADRIMAVNMIGTMVIAMIVITAAFLNETNILDIALIYAVMSFIAVILLSKIYIGVYRENKEKSRKEVKDEH